jgi:putative NADH-flavin reductase
MKIALIGATGYVGAKILDEALARGHQVTAVGRNPAAAGERPGLTARAVDVHDVPALAEVLRGHDAVINGFSPGRGASQDGIFEKFERGYRAIIDATKLSGVKRFLAVGGAGSLKTAAGIEFLESPEFPDIYRPNLNGIRGTREQYYMLKGEPELDWVFLAPSSFLTPGERTGAYRIGKDHLLVDENGESRISLEDYAKAMIDELEVPAHHRERFTVGM